MHHHALRHLVEAQDGLPWVYGTSTPSPRSAQTRPSQAPHLRETVEIGVRCEGALGILYERRIRQPLSQRATAMAVGLNAGEGRWALKERIMKGAGGDTPGPSRYFPKA